MSEAGVQHATVQPRIVVLSTLFPHPGQPNAGVFIRERMFRVGKRVPLVVVAPVPWFPFQSLLRLIKPHFRPDAPRVEVQQNVTVYHPRFLCVPGFLKNFDGLFMALGCYRTLQRLKREFNFNLIDSHFAYPDGYAATWLGRWFKVPVTITLRGTEVPQSKAGRAGHILTALNRASRVFSVAESLRRHVAELGADASNVVVVGNGVDTQKFTAIDRMAARSQLGIKPADKVLVSVGGLVERKGFHRVIPLLPELRKEFPELKFLIVGGASAEGDWTLRLQDLARAQGVDDIVQFLGPMPSERLTVPLSAADVFVLATSNEGWANVFLEAMACGLPVITTDVGGNREVVSSSVVGNVVPFGDAQALKNALSTALAKSWDRAAIVRYAHDNEWEGRVDTLVHEFSVLVQGQSSGAGSYDRSATGASL